MDTIALPNTVQAKYDALLDTMKGLGRIAVAYSGGVDSTLLLKAAGAALGRENALGVIASSETLSPDEFRAATALAEKHGFRIRVIEYSELEIENYADNPTNRCYFCKDELFKRVGDAAREEGFETVLDGSTYDDLTSDYRPGMRAADERGVLSPLVDLKCTKADVRALAQAFGLENWAKPSGACLSSRFPYGTKITREGLDQVGRAEAFLRAQGFTQIRVRRHETIARIEVLPGEIARFAADESFRRAVVEEFKKIGFRYITLDLQGYRTGSLNEGLDLPRGGLAKK